MYGIAFAEIIVLMACLGLCAMVAIVALIVRALRGSGQSQQMREKETEALHRTLAGLEKMDRRIQNLETILTDRARSESHRGGNR